MDYSRECGLLLDKFELELRSFIKANMETNFGRNWWRSNVPGLIVSRCKERQEQEATSRFPRIQTVTEPIHYTNLGELKDIICRKDNFQAVFRPYFGNVANVTARIEELIGYRNPAAQ